jgi:sec-independent protein translocase protein TatC
VRFRKPKNPEGRMTVVEHLAELRRRLIVSLVAVAVCGVIVFVFAPEIIHWLLQFYKDSAPARSPNKFIFTGPLDAFATRLKIATYGGIILALPIWLWELWRFITPGLNPNEKRYAVPFILSSIALFLFGGVVAFLVLQPALEFLLKIGGSDLTPYLTADKFVSLVSLMVLAFGLAFEFPVVLVFLLVARVITTRQLRRWRRIAIVSVVTFAAVITPSQDPYSLFAMAIPMYLFYEGSIIIGRILKR